jgi:hypothetical protein
MSAEKNTRLIAVEHDSEGIRLAALEMLTEFLYTEERRRTRRIAEQSADPQAVLAAVPKREFACGYYLWVTYLFGVEARMQLGIHTELTAADATGLLALGEARREFEREHPLCRCGRRMKNDVERVTGMCRACKDARDAGA